MDLYKHIMVEISKVCGGITVVTDNIPSFQSVKVVVAVKAGSSVESADISGMAHFLEHMAFKSTKFHTTKEIAEIFDEIGGAFNACTSREYTMYYIKVLGEYFEKGLSILSEILLHPLFLDEEIKTEQSVVLQEMAQTYDDLGDFICDLHMESMFKDSSFGRPILGTEETVLNLDSNALRKFIDLHYYPENIVIVMSGNVIHNNAVELIEKFFSMIANRTNTMINSVDNIIATSIPLYTPSYASHIRESEQAHILYGFESVNAQSPDLYTTAIMATVLGGGMSSRLFQEVREKRGLVYGISSSLSAYIKTGIVNIYTSCSDNSLVEIVDVIASEIKKLSNEKVDILAREVDRVKNSVRSSLYMMMESNSARANNIVNSFLVFGEYIDAQTLLSKYNMVTVESVIQMVKKVFFTDKCSVTVAGAISKMPDYQYIVEGFKV